MFKKLIMWFYFTIIAGILPTALKWLICQIANSQFEFNNICSEIYFFSLMLSFDGLKSLYDINNDKNFKVFFFASLIFIIIILSVIYGILLLDENSEFDLAVGNLYFFSILFTICCLIISFSIQILGGLEKNVNH